MFFPRPRKSKILPDKNPSFVINAAEKEIKEAKVTVISAEREIKRKSLPNKCI